MNSIYKKCHLPIGACWLLFVTITGCGQEPSPEQTQNTTVLKIVRGGGLPPPNAPQAEFEHYSFTVANDGTWEWRFGVFQKRGIKSGTLKADEVPRWIKEIEKGGFHQLESNPDLGYADESFVDITILTKDRQTQKRIGFGEKLAKAIHQKVIEVANSGEAIGNKSDRPLDAATFNAGLAPDDIDPRRSNLAKRTVLESRTSNSHGRKSEKTRMTACLPSHGRARRPTMTA